MNETDREVIEEMLDSIAHLAIMQYGTFARNMVDKLQIHINDHVHAGDWMDGFVTGLEWVLEELDGVRVV